MTQQPAYTYRATVTRWGDGDTVDLAVDAGFDVTVNTRFRLHGIDTPERGNEGYNAALAVPYPRAAATVSPTPPERPTS